MITVCIHGILGGLIFLFQTLTRSWQSTRPPWSPAVQSRTATVAKVGSVLGSALSGCYWTACPPCYIYIYRLYIYIHIYVLYIYIRGGGPFFKNAVCQRYLCNSGVTFCGFGDLAWLRYFFIQFSRDEELVLRSRIAIPPRGQDCCGMGGPRMGDHIKRCI